MGDPWMIHAPGGPPWLHPPLYRTACPCGRCDGSSQNVDQVAGTEQTLLGEKRNGRIEDTGGRRWAGLKRLSGHPLREKVYVGTKECDYGWEVKYRD
jgi:hypothetical protein